MKTPHNNAYLNPWNDAKDRPFTSHIAEVLAKWFRQKNGQVEDLSVTYQFGVDQSNGRTMSLLVRVVVVPRGSIG